MADTAISNLSAGAAVSATDVLPNVQTAGVGPVKTTAAQLKTFMSASPTLVTPTIGVATATSVNKVALTAPATGSTLTIADGKTLTANNTLTLAGTDGTTLTGPASSTTLAGLAIANVFTKAQTFQPDSDAQAGTFRRNGAAQTSNVVEIQTEANGFLAGFDKAGILTLGAASTQTGTLKLAGTTSGVVTLSTADAAGTWTMKLPTSAGTADYVLKTDGSGNTSWTAQTGGGGTPGGSNTQIQFNNSGAFAGDSDLVFDTATSKLTATYITATLGLNAGFGNFDVNDATGRCAAQGFVNANNQTYGFASTQYPTGATAADTMLSRGGAAATLQLGAGDAAAPVAQTFGVQSVVAGTSNTAGADWTIQGSRGTGTGIGGKIIFKTAPAGSTGTAQNSVSSAWAIDSNLTLYPAASLATNMTNGFINIPGAAGAASGTPANTTGFPMYYDSTNNKIYVYNGSWRSTAALT